MKIRHTGFFWNLIVVGAIFVVGPSAILASPSLISEVKTPPSEPMPRDGVPMARLSEAYGKLPLVFESNQGQTAPEVKFLSRGSGYGLFLTPTEAILTLSRRERPTRPSHGGRGHHPAKTGRLSRDQR